MLMVAGQQWWQEILMVTKDGNGSKPASKPEMVIVAVQELWKELVMVSGQQGWKEVVMLAGQKQWKEMCNKMLGGHI